MFVLVFSQREHGLDHWLHLGVPMASNNRKQDMHNTLNIFYCAKQMAFSIGKQIFFKDRC